MLPLIRTHCNTIVAIYTEWSEGDEEEYIYVTYMS